jgi:D-arabinose 1-dehydrogenase
MTKCGRYGLDKSDFDYSPDTIRASVARSLERLNTDFLDVVYLHDAEFVASPIYPKDRTGNPKDALSSNSSSAWGLDQASRREIHGSGDQIILGALSELFKLKQEGKIKAVGITGTVSPVM